MRRLLALSVAAAALALAAPAQAGDIVCTPGPASVCVGNSACPGRCFPEPYVTGPCIHPSDPPSLCDVSGTAVAAV